MGNPTSYSGKERNERGDYIEHLELTVSPNYDFTTPTTTQYSRTERKTTKTHMFDISSYIKKAQF